jgi:hypothetical protein
MAKSVKKVNTVQLFEFWNNHSLTRAEVARKLGVTRTQLERLADQYALPERPAKKRAHSITDPTPEEIAERALEFKLKHLAAKRAEKPTRQQIAICGTDTDDDMY